MGHPLIVFGGALVSATLVARFAPEAEGHGTDSAIEAVHTDPRSIRGRAVVVKMLSSALTIGSGGSGGREGPTAQISAGFGSLLTRAFNLADADGRVAVSLGIGSGIGAIFGAPLGGAVLAASIIYREDFDYKALVPGFLTQGPPTRSTARSWALRRCSVSSNPTTASTRPSWCGSW